MAIQACPTKGMAMRRTVVTVAAVVAGIVPLAAAAAPASAATSASSSCKDVTPVDVQINDPLAPGPNLLNAGGLCTLTLLCPSASGCALTESVTASGVGSQVYNTVDVGDSVHTWDTTCTAAVGQTSCSGSASDEVPGDEVLYATCSSGATELGVAINGSCTVSLDY
jgi:hypothetical protein